MIIKLLVFDYRKDTFKHLYKDKKNTDEIRV